MRCAHLSPNTPAVDVYMCAFGSTANPVILRHVSYGNVSDYMPVKAGQYTAFGSATGYQPLAPGSETVKFTSSGAEAAAPVDLDADTVHTIVVLDGSNGLKVDNLTDAAGSQAAASGGPDTGFGSTAPQPADSLPWLLTVAGGALLALAGWASLRRTRGARSGASQ